MISMVNHLLAEHADPNLSSAAGTGDSAITEKQSEGKKDIYFIHAARSSEAHALREELENLARRNRNLHLFIAYENVKEGEVAGKNYHMQGRLKLDEMPAACLPKEADYYLCGPVPFMQEQYQALLRLGIPPERIFSEAFTTGGVHL